MVAESFFTKVANDVLEATEQIANRMEEGITALLTGELPQHNQPTETHHGGDRGEDEDFEIYQDELGSSPLEGIAESVLGDIVSGHQKPQGFVENFHAFRHAITWTEPFVLGLVSFQIVVFLLSIWVSRKNQTTTPRLVVMIFIAVVVRMAERLNGLGALHWKSFATQNYFDRQGIFVSIMLCGPLLLDSLVMLICFLREASQLLVRVKTAEIKQKRQEQAARSKKEDKENKRRSKKEQ